MTALYTILASLHVPMPELMYWPAMLAELVIGIAFILGIATRYTSLFTFVYLIIATAIAHRYWEVPPAAVGAQYANFCQKPCDHGRRIAALRAWRRTVLTRRLAAPKLNL